MTIITQDADTLEELKDAPDSVGQSVHGLSKLVQECQNGLISAVSLLETGSTAPEDRETLMAAMETYGAEVEGSVVRRPTGLDIVLPSVLATVEFLPAAAVASVHRTLPPDTERATAPVRAHERRHWCPDAAKPSSIRDQALMLAEAYREGRKVDPAILSEFRGSSSWALATLASDLLNRQGLPAVPQFVHSHLATAALPATTTTRAARGTLPPHTLTAAQEWDTRITVDEYALFEATHPAYAAQVVTMAEFANRHAQLPVNRIVDIGSGPGLPTMILSELLPDAEIDAVEPSEVAYPYLVQNAADRNIVPHRSSVQEFTGQSEYPLVVSVGTSHHMDTQVFLRCLCRLTAPGGLVVIADEFISPFRNREERVTNIANHHWAYVRESLAHIDPDSLPDVERARLLTVLSLAEDEPDRLREAMPSLQANRVNHEGETGPWQRVRFAVLELEALLAGADYEVERKTYPAAFLQLAEREGLTLLAHERVYGTTGERDLDAGTHVFAFRPC